MATQDKGGVTAPRDSGYADVMAQLEAAQARIAAQEEQISNLRKGTNGKLTPKVSTNGAMSVYGLQRFPVTLYKEQWSRLFEAVPNLQAFLKANDSLLKAKPVKITGAAVTPAVEG